MEKTLAKTLIALVIGFTVGLFTGYTINYKTYYWTYRVGDRIEVSKKRLEKEIEYYIDKELEAHNKEANGLAFFDSRFEAKHRFDEKIMDDETLLWQNNTIKKFNYGMALLLGSATASIIIILLLGSEIIKNK